MPHTLSGNDGTLPGQGAIFWKRAVCVSPVQGSFHRAGGIEGSENTVAGLDAGWKAGAYGSEIDIQRTKDGYYVLNHDGTFKHFLCTDADGIITDNVSQAVAIASKLEERSDTDRMVDKIKTLF